MSIPKGKFYGRSWNDPLSADDLEEMGLRARQWWEKLLRYGSTDEERFKKFHDEWMINTKDQFEFVEKLGGAKWIAEARRQTKAAESENEDIDFSYQEYTPDNDTGLYY